METAQTAIRLVALDTSTKVSGCALFVGGKLVEHCAIDYSKEKDSELRMNMMAMSLVKRLNVWQPDIIVIEHPQGEGRNILIVNRLSEIVGAVRLYAAAKNVEFHEMMPTEWRKWAKLPQGKKKREELKQLSRQMVLDKYDILVRDDESDAILLGHGYINMIEDSEGHGSSF